MPAGRTHDRITLWSLPLVVGLTFERTRSSLFTLVVAGGFLFGGLMLGPDLDIHSRPYKRWGWFRWIWLPYRASIRHRSALSHAPITGTVLRVLYLGLWLALAGVVLVAIANDLTAGSLTWDGLGHLLTSLMQQHAPTWLALMVGLELGALSHYMADFSVSNYKRVKKQGIQALLPKPKKQRKRRKR